MSMSIESVNRIEPGNPIALKKKPAADKTPVGKADATISRTPAQKINAALVTKTLLDQQPNLVAIHAASRKTVNAVAKLDQPNARDHGSSPATNRGRAIDQTAKPNACATKSDLGDSAVQIWLSHDEALLCCEAGSGFMKTTLGAPTALTCWAAIEVFTPCSGPVLS